MQSDESIRRELISRLVWDRRLDNSLLDVEVDEARVKLGGVVSTQYVLEAVRENARSVAGVGGVECAVGVVSEGTYPDARLRDYVLHALRCESAIQDSEFVVSVHNGAVSIGGRVSAGWKKIRAEQVARRVAGVVQVCNALDVVAPAEE